MQPFPMQSGCLAWISATRCRRSWQAASRSRPWRTPGCRPLRPCGRRLTCSSRSTPFWCGSTFPGSRLAISRLCSRVVCWWSAVPATLRPVRTASGSTGWSAPVAHFSGRLHCPRRRPRRRCMPPSRTASSRRRAQGRTIPTSPGPGAWGADRRGPAALTVHEPALGRTIPSRCLRWPTRSGGRPRGGPCQVDPAGDDADGTEGLRVVAEGRAGGRLDLLWQQPPAGRHDRTGCRIAPWPGRRGPAGPGCRPQPEAAQQKRALVAGEPDGDSSGR